MLVGGSSNQKKCCLGAAAGTAHSGKRLVSRTTFCQSAKEEEAHSGLEKKCCWGPVFTAVLPWYGRRNVLTCLPWEGPSHKLVFKFSIWKLKTKVENPIVGFVFSFKFSTFGTLPKSSFQVSNLKVENQSWKPKGRTWFFFQVFNFWDPPQK